MAIRGLSIRSKLMQAAAVAALVLVGACNPGPQVEPSASATRIPSTAFEPFETEPHVAMIAPGISSACPGGALFVGFNDHGRADPVLADQYVQLGGLAANITPSSDLSTWLVPAHGFLTNIARTDTAAAVRPVRELRGDPHLTVGSGGRLLYVNMASHSVHGALDSIVVLRSDDCGGSWSTGDVPLRVTDPIEFVDIDLEIDRPRLYRNPLNGALWLVFLSTSLEPGAWSARSFDNGVTWSTPTPFPWTIDSALGLHYTPVLVFPGQASVAAIWAQAFTTRDRAVPPVVRYFFSLASDSGTPGWTPRHQIAPPTLIPPRVLGAFASDTSIKNDWTAAAAVLNGHFVVALPTWVSQSGTGQWIDVRESVDGVSWTTRFDTRFSATANTSDAFFPVLAAGPSPTHTFLMTWFDARQSSDRAAVQVLSTASTDDGASWRSTPVDVSRTTPFRPYWLGPPEHYWGDFFGADVVAFESSSTTTSFAVVWMDSRTENQTHLYANRVVVRP